VILLGGQALRENSILFYCTTQDLDFQIVLGKLFGALNRGHHVAVENLQGDLALPSTGVHSRVQGHHHVELRYNVQSLSAEPYRSCPFHFVAVKQRAA
jgi:hypothetical protein